MTWLIEISSFALGPWYWIDCVALRMTGYERVGSLLISLFFVWYLWLPRLDGTIRLLTLMCSWFTSSTPEKGRLAY